MKTIGMLGGMSWEGASEYYQIINTVVREKLGDTHTAKCLMYSADFHDLENKLEKGDWKGCAKILVDGAQRLESGGADFIVLCTNTLHRVSGEIAEAVSIPLVHIADATLEVLKQRCARRVGLLGTRYTMEQEFNKARLTAEGIEVMVPDKKAREELNRIVFDELRKGLGKDASREYVIDLLDEFARKKVDGVILGCVEIGLLIDQQDSRVPLIDATRIHATRAAELAME